MAEPQRKFRGYRPLAAHDMADAHGRHPDFLRQPVLGQSQLFQQLFQIGSRMHGSDAASGHFFSSVIVDELYSLGVPLSPQKANPPLAIDSDTMLPLAVSFESLQTV